MMLTHLSWTVWNRCFSTNVSNFNAYISGRLRTILEESYHELTVPVEHMITADTEIFAPLDEEYIELRLQTFSEENLPETLSYRDVAEMERCMQRNKVVLVTQLFESLHDRVAPRCVLLRGKAGVGKTTLMGFISSQWAKGLLWKEIFSYVFVLTLRELIQDEPLTLCDLLLAGLSLSEAEKRAALDEIVQNSRKVLIIIDGVDEFREFKYSTQFEQSCTSPVSLSVLISSIMGSRILPGCKAIVTSRPISHLPMKAFPRTVEVYGFTQESVMKFVHKFSDGKKDLEKYIVNSLEDSPNLATFCYVPLQCRFVCAALEDMYSSSGVGDLPVIRTMTQLYVHATTILAQKLHPRLKGNMEPMEFDELFRVLREPFIKHAELAKRVVTTSPLQLIFYKDDLKSAGMAEDSDDLQCGFLAGSQKADPRIQRHKRRCWSFAHLTLQEFFGSVGLVKGSLEDIESLMCNEASIRQYEVVLTFLAGLAGDPTNGYYVGPLMSSDASQFDCSQFVEILAAKLRGDPLKFVTIMYETQNPDLASLVPEAIQPQTLYPTEMRALVWVMEQDTNRITTLE